MIQDQLGRPLHFRYAKVDPHGEAHILVMQEGTAINLETLCNLGRRVPALTDTFVPEQDMTACRRCRTIGIQHGVLLSDTSIYPEMFA